MVEHSYVALKVVASADVSCDCYNCMGAPGIGQYEEEMLDAPEASRCNIDVVSGAGLHTLRDGMISNSEAVSVVSTIQVYFRCSIIIGTKHPTRPQHYSKPDTGSTSSRGGTDTSCTQLTASDPARPKCGLCATADAGASRQYLA